MKAITYNLAKSQLRETYARQGFHSLEQAEDSFRQYFLDLCELSNFYTQPFTASLFTFTFAGWDYQPELEVYICTETECYVNIQEHEETCTIWLGMLDVDGGFLPLVQYQVRTLADFLAVAGTVSFELTLKLHVLDL